MNGNTKINNNSTFLARSPDVKYVGASIKKKKNMSRKTYNYFYLIWAGIDYESTTEKRRLKSCGKPMTES